MNLCTASTTTPPHVEHAGDPGCPSTTQAARTRGLTPWPRWAAHGLAYVADARGLVHLAERATGGNYASGCSLAAGAVEVTPVPDDQVCPSCVDDVEQLHADYARHGVPGGVL